MNFVIVDIVLLVIFVLFVSAFLYINKKNLKKDGLLYLYRTTWGMRFIDKIGKKYQKTLKFLSYVSITIGYLLMIGMLYLFGRILYLYVAYPSIVRAIKIPPITPLFPYVDRLVPNLGLPSFYFIYFVIVIAVIAITHEFAHGIFMRHYGIKIKSTGFGFFPFFFPVFPAAFVEQDEKSMNKSKTFHQMAVLSAGTFANILTAVFFFFVIWLFFSLAFFPAGAQFNTYSYAAVGIVGISSINGVDLENPTYEKLLELSNDEGLNEIKVNGRDFVAEKEFLEEQSSDLDYLILYDDAPAINAGLEGAVVEIDGVKINGWESFGTEITKHSPEDNITIKTKVDNEVKTYEITLGENPEDSEKPWLGVGFRSQKRSGLIGKVTDLLSFKKSHIYYEPKFEVADFIYDLLWWLILISFSVALVNMLPMGIFDGGRFFYLTILGLTKSERKAEKWFKGVTRFLLFLLFVLMAFWVWSFIG